MNRTNRIRNFEIQAEPSDLVSRLEKLSNTCRQMTAFDWSMVVFQPPAKFDQHVASIDNRKPTL